MAPAGHCSALGPHVLGDGSARERGRGGVTQEERVDRAREQPRAVLLLQLPLNPLLVRALGDPRPGP